MNPDEEQSRRSGRNIVALKGMVSTPPKRKLNNSGAATPAQASAFEIFRLRLNHNLMNTRSQSQSIADLEVIERQDQRQESVDVKRQLYRSLSQHSHGSEVHK